MSASLFGTSCPTRALTPDSDGCGASPGALGIFSNFVDLGLAPPTTKAVPGRTRAVRRNPPADVASYVFIEPETSFDAGVRLAFMKAANIPSCPAGPTCDFTRLGEPLFITDISPQNVAAWYSVRRSESAGSSATDPNLDQMLGDLTDDPSGNADISRDAADLRSLDNPVTDKITNPASANFAEVLNPADAVVPEPASLTLISIGLIGLACLKKIAGSRFGPAFVSRIR
jgi:hypothetical protein